MKTITTIVLTALLAVSSPAQAITPDKPAAEVKTGLTLFLDQARQASVKANIHQLQRHIGRTWYVFSGATPTGWDCSGLTMWFYAQLGQDIPHSANKQAQLHGWTNKPVLGDLVLFGYPGTNSFFHAAIYYGNNRVIHAGFHKGTRTEVLSLTSPAVKNLKIRFIHLAN